MRRVIGDLFYCSHFFVELAHLSLVSGHFLQQERNKAQIESFVDEEDQWQSLEEEERDLLNSKHSITQKMEELAEQLVMLFMGQKMRNG